METPLELTFRGVDHTEDRESLVREKVAKLEEVCDTITTCQVIVERDHESKQSGNPLQMRVTLHVPRHRDVVVSRELTVDEAVDPFPSLAAEVFESVRRQLSDIREQQRGQVKADVGIDHLAVVAKLFPERDYGFLETMDRREIFFHRNAVLNNDFDRLEPGVGVRFVEEEGEKGPQASSVLIVDKPGVSTPRARASEG